MIPDHDPPAGHGYWHGSATSEIAKRDRRIAELEAALSKSEAEKRALVGAMEGMRLPAILMLELLEKTT